MSFDVKQIDAAANKILQQIEGGEISEACYMSSLSTPVSEAWEAAGSLADNAQLSQPQQQALLQSLNHSIQQQLVTSDFDDFDLIYERILSLIGAS